MKKLVTILTLGAALLAAAAAEAGNLDTYRNLLARNTLTIKYEDITPVYRQTNKDKVSFYGKDGMNLNNANFVLNKQTEGIVVVNGADKYEEVGVGTTSVCSLTKGDKSYIFSKFELNGKTEYYGSRGKGKVEANDRAMLAAALTGESYAGENLTRLLCAALPPEKKSADMPVYHYVGSGWLPGGLNYEDYRSDHEGVLEAVRYYFNGYELVKIAAASYYTLPDGSIDGKKTIIKIKEFSSKPDMSYLELPAGVKDVTKKK